MSKLGTSIRSKVRQGSLFNAEVIDIGVGVASVRLGPRGAVYSNLKVVGGPVVVGQVVRIDFSTNPPQIVAIGAPTYEPGVMVPSIRTISRVGVSGEPIGPQPVYWNPIPTRSWVWTKLRPYGDTPKYWRTVSASHDGMVIAVNSINSIDLMISYNGGSTWTTTDPTMHGGYTDIDKVVVSFDGTFIAVAEYGSNQAYESGFIYTSDDAGETWTKRTPCGSTVKAWQIIDCSDDGSFIISGQALNWSGRLWMSSNSGVDWTETRPVGNFSRNWSAVACDSDGSHLIAGCCDGTSANSRLYISTDSGANWTETQPVGNNGRVWSGVAINSDGTVLMAVDSSDGFWISTDSGSNWSQITATDYDLHLGVECDASGQQMVVIAESTIDFVHSLFTSEDEGDTWNKEQPALQENGSWEPICFAGDGNCIVVGSRYYGDHNGFLYIGRR